MLTTLGCEVDVAENGVEAIDASTRAEYDLILMDCHMPVMDGFSASREIRRLEQTQGRERTPVIAITADVQKGIRQKCRDSGMDDYLSKPFTQSMLTQVIQKWLRMDPVPATNEQPSVATPPPEPVLLEAGRLEQLRSIGKTSGRDVLGRSIDLFLGQTPRDVRGLRQAMETGDAVSLQNIAHSLKSGSANLGASSFSNLCLQLEHAARDEKLDEIPKLVLALEALIPRVFDAMNDVLAVQRQPMSEAAQTQTQRHRILLVDDDPGFRETTSEVLLGAGFIVDLAVGGEEALISIERNAPDLVLLDAMMPGMDGFELCRHLRKRPQFHCTPILMVTGLDDMDSVNLAFKSGADGFTTKPLNYTVLIHRLRFQLRAAQDAKALQESQERLANAQRMARLGYWRWDSRSGELIASEQLTSMIASRRDSCCRTLDDYLERIHPEDREFIHNCISLVLEGEPQQPTDFRMLTENNKEVIVHQVLDLSPESDRVVLGTVQDITQQRLAEQRVRQLAYFDELTGIASRAYFYQHTGDLIKGALRREERFSLLYLDLDGFKEVNDSLGHDAGDELLKIIAQRLQSLLRDSDFVARLSGDEFCILIDNVDDQYDATFVSNRCLQEINRPVTLAMQTIRPRCSIGIAHFPEDGRDLQTLLKAADSAMYAAKEHGKHRYAFYQPALTALAQTRLQMEQDLRMALERNELVLHYYPQIGLRSGRLVGVEALVQWQHPVKGLLPPDEFIYIAERIGMINALDEWVLKTACAQAVSWKRTGLSRFRMAVNIAPAHFRNKSLATTIVEVLDATGFDAADLELVVTESVMQTTGENIDIFNRLRSIGVRIVIDDFSTGYSSLASLKYLPVDCLKIDRMFITDMLKDPDSSILLGAIVSVARALGHEVAAEGVETREQLIALSGIGCELVQGLYFSRPVTVDRIPELARQDFLPVASIFAAGEPTMAASKQD
jgi:diguanylate cyclase (GGDEF)-like protein